MLTFFLLSVIILVCLGLASLGCYLLSDPKIFNLTGELLLQSIAILCSVILMVLLACFAVYKWILHFLMSVITKITKIHPPKLESPRKKSQSSTVFFLKTDSSSPNQKNLSQSKMSNITICPMETSVVESFN